MQMEKNPFISSWPFIMIFLWSCSSLETHFNTSQCLEDQKSFLLELKHTLIFDPEDHKSKLPDWNEGTNCCLWTGVECETSSGRVIGLDLSMKGIISGIDSSSSLFYLKFLQRLNLADNNIQSEIPSSIGKLSNLSYLNLSAAGFSGQVPIEISELMQLNVLDLSYFLGPWPSFNDTPKLYMESPNLGTIIRNLNNITELYLDGVNSSAMGNKWCDALSSSLPRLQVLSMSECDLRGEIHNSLSKLHHLSVIHLGGNHRLTGTVPNFLAKFVNLTRLEIYDCDLRGTVPRAIFQIPTLRILALSANWKLNGTLPEFYKNGSLEQLELSETSFSGNLPSSISNLKRLRFIDLSDCMFQGRIPSSMKTLNLLEDVDLSVNNFLGPIPSFSLATNLNSLDLSDNNLSGNITGTNWGKLLNLKLFYMRNNALDGIVPMSLFSLPSISDIDLSNNKFSGQMYEFTSAPSLMNLYLSNNNLEGTLNLTQLLHKFQNLNDLDLSHNSWSVYTDYRGANSSVAQLSSLNLASCNVQNIPDFLKNQTTLEYIDLSMNQISGTVPKWIWRTNIFSDNQDQSTLNISYNQLVHLESPSPSSNTSFLWSTIDLQSNNLQGRIPTVLCDVTKLQLLNLENNHLNGTIPDCLVSMATISVLNLRNNNLGGKIPDKFGGTCNLQTLNLNRNSLRGRIPRSLAKCETLKVLDLGNNLLHDTFPCDLKILHNLQVLVLRSNKFYGTIICPEVYSIWPMLQIVDLASNNFSGELRAQNLFKWTAMMGGTAKGQPKLGYLQSNMTTGYYQNQVTITFKNNEYEMQYILTIFTSIDFSNNAFEGELPRELGNLNALVVLNLSHNSFSGNIPSSIGSVTQIESLDLSCNDLNGTIPQELANLNFLDYLNLSYNKLSGIIPTGPQLQLFTASSYEGNQGLYGSPLTPFLKSETDPRMTSPTSSESSKSEMESMIMGGEVGFPLGIVIFLGPLLYIKRYREWYCKHLHRLVMKIMCKDDATGRKRRQERHRY